MKRIAYLLSVMLMTVSCFDGTYSETYTLVANFEYGNSVTLSADSTYFDAKGGIGIGYGDLAFMHSVNEAGNFQGGFLYSCLKGTSSVDSEEETSTSADLYRVNGVGRGASGSTGYLVFYDSKDVATMPTDGHVVFMNPDYGTCSMDKCYVNNTACVADLVKDLFSEGDKLTLKATGYLDDNVTGEASIYLAGYPLAREDGTVVADSVVSTWTLFDISKLGSVDRIDFSIVAPEGKDIPAYFCLDNITANIAIEY